MSDMIERVAKAIFLDRYPESEDDWPDDIGVCELGSANDIRGHARAAIKALREPTEAMCQAVGDGLGGVTKEYWTGMIDAALK